MKTQMRTLLAIGVVSAATLFLGSAAYATPPADLSDVNILAGYCHCYEAANTAIRPADFGKEVDMAVINSRRYRAEQAARAADEAVKHVDLQDLRARRDQAIQDVAAILQAADQGEEVDMAVLTNRRYQANELTHAVLGAEMALERAAHHL